MKETTISVSMICRDSADVLAKCLESVKGADEIVIVDTGSSDNTKEIAESYGAKVYDYYGCNVPATKDGVFMNFSDARNYSLDRCTMSHVLIIDSDEELKTPIDKLRTFKDRALSVLCINNRTGEEHRQPRFFRRDPDIRWHRPAHNYLSCGSGIMSDALIHYAPSNARKAKDPDRTMRILRYWIKHNPKDCLRERYYLSKEYYKRGWLKKAEKELLHYIKRSTFKEEKTDAYVMLARSLAGQGRYREATNSLMAALHMNPQMQEVYSMLGDMADDCNRIKYKDMACKATNWGVLFARKDQRMKVTVLSRIDFAGTGYRLAQAVRRASGNTIDIEAITRAEGVGKFDIKTGPSYLRVGPDVVERRIDSSDIILFSGDWAYTDNWEGIKLPEDRIKIYYYIGSFFRRGREKEVSFALHELEDYVAHYHAAGSPDLLYNEQIRLVEIPWLDFSYTWKQPKGLFKKPKFNVLHVPSDPLKKGTDVVKEAMEKVLSWRDDVNFTCVTDISHKEMMKLKQSAHLYIDQMLLPVYGTAAVEAMSMGIPVVNWSEDLYPYDTPIISPAERQPGALASAINSALDWDFLEKQSKLTYNYVQKVHGTIGYKWVDIFKKLAG